MAFTKINAAGIGSTELVTLHSLEVLNNATVGGVLTYEDVTNVDSVGLITARNGIVVGSGITLSKDGDIFATGITTVSGNVKVGTGITLSPDGDIFTTGISTFGGNIQLSGTDPEIELNSGGPRFRVPASNTLTIHTGSGLGSANEERLRITSTGQLGIGVQGANANNKIHARLSDASIASNSTASVILAENNGNSWITIGSAASSYGGILFADSGSADIGQVRYNHSDNRLEIYTNGSERLHIDSNGTAILKNTTAAVTRSDFFGTLRPLSQIASNWNAYHSLTRHDDSSYSSYLILAKNRNTAYNSNTIVQNNDEFGNISFQGNDGSVFREGARIRGAVDGTPGDNDMPGRMTFWTTPDGSGSPIERMRISKDGHVTKPYQFHIVVDRSGNQDGYNPSQGFGTGIVYNNVVTVQGTTSAALDTSNGRITVPVAGIYFLEASAYSNVQVFTQGWFTKNGSRLSYSDFMNNSGNSQNVNAVGFHKLAAGDEVGYKAYGSGSTSTTIVTTANHTWMRVTLVG